MVAASWSRSHVNVDKANFEKHASNGDAFPAKNRAARNLQWLCPGSWRGGNFGKSGGEHFLSTTMCVMAAADGCCYRKDVNGWRVCL
jgi:hypothetical protein